MINQRLTEWTEASKRSDIYYVTQFEKPYRSTVAFTDFLISHGCFQTQARNRRLRILDVGAGMGETLFYMARCCTHVDFYGIDINPDLIKKGNEIISQSGQKNLHLEIQDLYKISANTQMRFEGIVSLQTLSWLPDFHDPVKKMCSLAPEWIGLTSLFYNGPVDCRIEVRDYSKPLFSQPYKASFYNIYSIPLVSQLFLECGYDTVFEPFEIDIDLEMPTDLGMGTYTRKVEGGKRLQFSGPLLMNWYFLLARRRIV